MRILIARHADPDYEKDGLTSYGKMEAESLARRLKNESIDYVYVSPLGRARETANCYLELAHKKAETKEFLREFLHPISAKEIGDLGQPWDFMPKFYSNSKELHSMEDWLEVAFMKEGKIKEYYDDVTAQFDAMLSKHGYNREGGYYRAVRPNKDTILLFCHFGIECVILSHLCSVPPMIFSQNFCVLPSGLTTIMTEEREEGIASMRCISFGDLSHLYQDKLQPSFAGRFCEVYTDFDIRH